MGLFNFLRSAGIPSIIKKLHTVEQQVQEFLPPLEHGCSYTALNLGGEESASNIPVLSYLPANPNLFYIQLDDNNEGKVDTVFIVNLTTKKYVEIPDWFEENPYYNDLPTDGENSFDENIAKYRTEKVRNILEPLNWLS